MTRSSGVAAERAPSATLGMYTDDSGIHPSGQGAVQFGASLYASIRCMVLPPPPALPPRLGAGGKGLGFWGGRKAPAPKPHRRAPPARRSGKGAGGMGLIPVQNAGRWLALKMNYTPPARAQPRRGPAPLPRGGQGQGEGGSCASASPRTGRKYLAKALGWPPVRRLSLTPALSLAGRGNAPGGRPGARRRRPGPPGPGRRTGPGRGSARRGGAATVRPAH